MTNIIRAEFLKSKRTMSSKLIVVFPIITLVMAFVLTLGMTNAYAESAWNWWYVLLPVSYTHLTLPTICSV